MGAVTGYLKKIIARQVEDHHLVVWFDPDGHYRQVAEALKLPGTKVACYGGSFFALRYEVEPLMNDLDPPSLIIYVPMAEEDTQQALVEFTRAGVVLKPGQQPWQRNTRLSVIARHALRPIIGEEGAAAIEKQVEAGKLSLVELDKIARKGEGLNGRVVYAIFGTADAQEAALAFLSSAQWDQAITEKKAMGEVAAFLESALEVELPAGESPEAWRARLARHILATAFLLELRGEIPAPLVSVRTAKQEIAKQACFWVAKTWRLREDLRASYVKWASRVEQELGLRKISFELEQIVSNDTFLAIETILQEAVERELLAGANPELIAMARQRQSSFWARQVPEVQARWALIAAAGQLLLEADRIANEIKKMPVNVEVVSLAQSYTAGENPWCLLDTFHRHMEQYYQSFDFAPADSFENLEMLVVRARQRYMEAGGRLAECFVKSFSGNKFKIPGFLRQTEIYQALVAPAVKEGKTAYVLVDALRFEMARELAQALAQTFDVLLQPAIAAVPTITEVGMAALMPQGGAEPVLVPAEKGKLGLIIEEKLLKDRPSRLKFLSVKAGVQVCDLWLDDLIPSPRKKAREALAEAQLIVITTREIDDLCEKDNISLARRIMDDVLHQLRRAFRILVEQGIKNIILAADHGYLFGEELTSDMKITPPGGETLDLHRRVWIGRGGFNDPSFIRVTAADFGLGGDLEIAVPVGFGAFKQPGGARAYFHGGLSPQELIIPVARFTPRTPQVISPGTDLTWRLIPGSKKISTRFFSVQIHGEANTLFAVFPPLIRVEIRAKGEVISIPVAASYGFTEATGDVQMRLADDNDRALDPVAVTLLVTGKPAQKTVNVYLLEALTGRELARLENIELAIVI
ncbi:MAG: PglZ domain-containing protein [Bacillota bacterium]